MKKWKLLILLLSMTTLMGMDGCGGGDTQEDDYDYSRDNSEDQLYQEE